MTKFIESLLKERKIYKFQLAEYMEISGPALSYKLKNDFWTFSDWLKIIDFFGLTNDEILSYMQKAREEK